MLKYFCNLEPVWPVKSRQMSIKVAQKEVHKKNERFWHLYKNYLKMWASFENYYFRRLWKVAQIAINHPIWSHCMEQWKRWLSNWQQIRHVYTEQIDCIGIPDPGPNAINKFSVNKKQSSFVKQFYKMTWLFIKKEKVIWRASFIKWKLYET